MNPAVRGLPVHIAHPHNVRKPSGLFVQPPRSVPSMSPMRFLPRNSVPAKAMYTAQAPAGPVYAPSPLNFTQHSAPRPAFAMQMLPPHTHVRQHATARTAAVPLTVVPSKVAKPVVNVLSVLPEILKQLEAFTNVVGQLSEGSLRDYGRSILTRLLRDMCSMKIGEEVRQPGQKKPVILPTEAICSHILKRKRVEPCRAHSDCLLYAAVMQHWSAFESLIKFLPSDKDLGHDLTYLLLVKANAPGFAKKLSEKWRGLIEEHANVFANAKVNAAVFVAPFVCQLLEARCPKEPGWTLADVEAKCVQILGRHCNSGVDSVRPTSRESRIVNTVSHNSDVSTHPPASHTPDNGGFQAEVQRLRSRIESLEQQLDGVHKSLAQKDLALKILQKQLDETAEGNALKRCKLDQRGDEQL